MTKINTKRGLTDTIGCPARGSPGRLTTSLTIWSKGKTSVESRCSGQSNIRDATVPTN